MLLTHLAKVAQVEVVVEDLQVVLLDQVRLMEQLAKPIQVVVAVEDLMEATMVAQVVKV